MGQYYKPCNLDKKEYVHTHDYQCGLKLMEHSYIGNPVSNAIENLIIPGGSWYKARLVWTGDYADKEISHDKNLYSMLNDDGTKIQPPDKKVDSEYKYLVNYSKGVYVDLSKIKPDTTDFKIHPLPLLVAEGNGRGGGDFHKEDPRIGIWARNSISLEASIPEGFSEVNGQFTE